MIRAFGTRRTPAIVFAGVALTLAIFASQTANANVTATYIGGGTLVYEQGGQNPNDPRVDKGTLVCDQATGNGVGGVCLTAEGLNGVLVHDDVKENRVAFQVCIDTNGDGRCVSQQLDPGVDPCQVGVDLIFFSHDDQGLFHNPLGPLPPASTRCPGFELQGFKGYIVFLCEGVHVPRDSSGTGLPHSHQATTGTATAIQSLQYDGYGNFCGGLKDQVVKEYQIV